jgi:hypothetical protein
MVTCISLPAVVAVGADGTAAARRSTNDASGAPHKAAPHALAAPHPPALFGCFDGGAGARSATHESAHRVGGESGAPHKAAPHAPAGPHPPALLGCFGGGAGARSAAHDSALSLPASAAAALAAVAAVGAPPKPPPQPAAAAASPGVAATTRRLLRAARRRAAAAVGAARARHAAPALRGGTPAPRGGAPAPGAKRARPICLVTGTVIPDFGVDGVFDVLHLLGEGGSAATFLCRDLASSEVVAVKFFERPLPKAAVPLMLVRRAHAQHAWRGRGATGASAGECQQHTGQGSRSRAPHRRLRRATAAARLEHCPRQPQASTAGRGPYHPAALPPLPTAHRLRPRSQREVQLQARLGQGHPNIVGVHEAILTESHLALVLDYAAGGASGAGAGASGAGLAQRRAGALRGGPAQGRGGQAPPLRRWRRAPPAAAERGPRAACMQPLDCRAPRARPRPAPPQAAR